MNQDNQGNNPDASANINLKRKRGRPRKYPRPNLILGENANVPRDHNLNRGEHARVPPGFEAVNGNQPHRVDPIDDANELVVGQVVSGVIEAAFDAGYLLSVRLGNSETALRGVVFKPGHYIPVSADNDVAPNVQMIRRNEIPFPTENYTQVHGHNPRSRERNEQHVNFHRNGTAHTFSEPPAANQVPRVAPRPVNPEASKGKQVPLAAAQTAHPVISRVNMVPVVLQPVNLPNGGPVVNQLSPVALQTVHPVASKAKEALGAAHPLNGSTPTNQVPTVGNQVLPSQPPTSHQVMPKAVESETGLRNQPPPELLREAEAKSMRLPGMPFEKLLTEVIKRIQAPSQSVKTQIENSKLVDKSSVKDSGHGLEGDVEPLQVVQPYLLNNSASVSRPLENYRTGKMTELLQAVQENMTENPAPQAEEPATGSSLNLDELSSPDTQLGDKENAQSKKCSRASSV